MIKRPLQPTNLLPVSDQLTRKLRSIPQIPIQNILIPGARTEIHGVIPGYTAHAAHMADHRPDLGNFLGIPQLHLARIGPYGQQIILLGPGRSRDHIVETHLAELADSAGHGVPHVDAGVEADRQDVLLGPVDEVQVEVVLQGGGVQHLYRRFVDFALDCGSGCLQKLF